MIDINHINIGDIWYYNENNSQYIGTVVAIDTIAPVLTFAFNDNSDIIKDRFITIDWYWVNDPTHPGTQAVGHITYDSIDLRADRYHDWIQYTSRITEKEKLTIILSTK